MRKINVRPLWLGHVGDTRQPRLLLDAEITAVVELADSEPFADLPRELVRCRFPLSDGGPNSSWLVQLAVQTTASLVRAGVSTFVSCGVGMSRSVAVAAGALAFVEKRDLRDALAEVAAAGPVDVSPGLMADVQNALGELSRP